MFIQIKKKNPKAQGDWVGEGDNSQRQMLITNKTLIR